MFRLLSTLTFLYSQIVNFCVLKDTFLRSIHKHIRVFCLLADIPTFAIFNMDHTPLELVKPYIQNVVDMTADVYKTPYLKIDLVCEESGIEAVPKVADVIAVYHKIINDVSASV